MNVCLSQSCSMLVDDGSTADNTNVMSFYSPSLSLSSWRHTLSREQILAKTMIQGLKTVIWCCSNYRQPKQPDASNSGAGGVLSSQSAVIRRPMTAEERDHTAKFFKWALPCLRVFTKSGGVVSPGESKDALDAFAGAFTVLGPYDLRTAVSWLRMYGLLSKNIDS